MGNRLSKIYTRTGDDGSTGLADGSRVHKSDLRIHVMGEIDELNSCIARILLHKLRKDLESEVRIVLANIQHQLFDIGGEIAIPGMEAISQEDIDRLETALDHLNKELNPLKEFILPGGGQAAVDTHFARCVCRRVERNLHALALDNCCNQFSLKLLNRLSDYLFVLARSLTVGEEVYWVQKARRPE